MVDCETNEPSIKPFIVPRNGRGQLDVAAIEKSLAASQHILEGIVQGDRHGYPACRDGWTRISYTNTPIQLQVAPKPGKHAMHCLQIGSLEVQFLSPCVCPCCAMAGTAKAVFTISLRDSRHSSDCTVAGARPKQALAYPTQHSFLGQMWRTLVA